MGFFSDFIGSFTGKNERDAAKDQVASINKGIKYTQDEINSVREKLMPLYQSAFENTQMAVDKVVPLRQKTLAAQLQMLGISPDSSTNSLQRAGNAGMAALLGDEADYMRPPKDSAPVQSPFNEPPPQYKNPLLGVN